MLYLSARTSAIVFSKAVFTPSSSVWHMNQDAEPTPKNQKLSIAFFSCRNPPPSLRFQPLAGSPCVVTSPTFLCGSLSVTESTSGAGLAFDIGTFVGEEARKFSRLGSWALGSDFDCLTCGALSLIGPHQNSFPVSYLLRRISQKKKKGKHCILLSASAVLSSQAPRPPRS